MSEGEDQVLDAIAGETARKVWAELDRQKRKGTEKMTRNLPPPPAKSTPGLAQVAFGKIANATGHRVVIYGPGGIGKTTLACHAPGPVAFFDLDDSLSRLLPQLTAAGLTDAIMPVEVSGWQDIRNSLHAPGWDAVKTIVIDSATKAEELCVAHTLATVPHEKGQRCHSIEDYGYGKGYTHVFDQFLPILADLDAHCRAGRNVVLICHDCATTCPNTMGEDWLRYEPRLQSPNSGKASIRLRVREWADHMLFYGYDVAVKDGKGVGSGTRTIYPTELPHCMAKSRTCQFQIPVDTPDGALWGQVINGQTA